MAIVAERHYEAMQARARAGSDSSLRGAALGSGGVNTYSLSLYSDIPREAARRKVKDLIAKGWLSADRRET